MMLFSRIGQLSRSNAQSERLAFASLFKAFFLGIALACAVVSCGGGGGDGVSGGGTGGGIPVSSGPINGFGSIIVAGYEFDEPISATTSQDGQPVTAEDLGLGIHVSVKNGTSTLDSANLNRVKQIEIKRWFMGELVVGATSYTINGQRVLNDDRTIIAGAASATQLIGQKVQIAGYLIAETNDIIATRIEKAKPNLVAIDRIYTTGVVRSFNTNEKVLSLGFSDVNISSAVAGETSLIQVGDVVRIEGSFSTANTRTLIASRWSKITPSAAQGDVSLRGVVMSRPTASSPTVPLIVDGYQIPVFTINATDEGRLRRGAVVEVSGSQDGLIIRNAAVKVIGVPIEKLRGEEAVLPPRIDPEFAGYDYTMKDVAVSSVDPTTRSFVMRGVRIRLRTGETFPTQLAVGSIVSIRGRALQDSQGFYLEATITSLTP